MPSAAISSASSRRSITFGTHKSREAAMTSLAHFESVARAIELPDRAVIDGRLEPSATGRTFDNMTPRNGTVINRVAECDVADVDKAVAAARCSFEDGRWR